MTAKKPARVTDEPHEPTGSPYHVQHGDSALTFFGCKCGTEHGPLPQETKWIYEFKDAAMAAERRKK